MPNIIDILDQLGNAKYFSVFDLASGFHQIPMTFQRLMDKVLNRLQGLELFMYLDDPSMIMIYYVMYKAEKMNCNADALSRNPVPSPTLNNGVFPPRQDLLTKNATAILFKNTGAIDVANAFVDDFICLYWALKALLTEGTHFLNSLIKAIAKKFKIVRYNTIGAVLQQHSNGFLQPLNFCSRKLKPMQTKYNAYDRELLTIYAAIKHFRYMLEGRNFHVIMDHKPLVYAFKRKSDQIPKTNPSNLDELQQLKQSTSTSLKLKKFTLSETASNIYCDTSEELQFEAQLFGALTKLVGSKYCQTTAYHLESNSIIERWHRSLKTALSLVSLQISGKKNKKFFYDRYLHYFSTNKKLQSHVMDCEKLECVLRKMELDRENASSYTYQRHEVFTRTYSRSQYNDALSSYRFRRDEDCIAWFARQLNNFEHRVKNIVSANVHMETLSKEQLEAYRSATRCHICEKPFAPDDTRVRDHCHLTGRFRGPAHAKSCNLNYKNSFYIPIVFHNLSGYDTHFIIKEIAIAYEGHVDVLPITKEKYISFTKHVQDTAERADSRKCIKLRFIDSFKFLNANLDKLASFLSRDKLKIVRSKFSTLSDEEFELLTRKGVFPYEYASSKNLIAVELRKLVKFDKPIYVGMCILDISKVCLYEFHHEYMLPLFRIMTEFVGLRAKMYTVRVDGKREIKKAKGVKSNVVARTITFDDYTRCLNEEIEITRRQSCIRCKLYDVYTISESKIALSPYDDKRYVVPDSTETLPWGHGGYLCNMCVCVCVSTFILLLCFFHIFKYFYTVYMLLLYTIIIIIYT
ncbi:POL3 protein, partial [Pseudoatta argentina]